MSVTSSTTCGSVWNSWQRRPDLDGGDRRAFQRGEQHAAQGVADRVAVSGLKRFSDKLAVVSVRSPLLW